MECITTVSYSVKINGQIHEYFKPSRGLRQGDPLLPYFFILCAKGLSSIIHAACKTSVIEGIKMSRHCPPLSHLFFADDSFLFEYGTLKESAMYKALINKYCSESGQEVNKMKSSLYFSRNTDLRTKVRISKLLGIQINSKAEKYLWDGINFQRNWCTYFDGLQERIATKASS